MNGGYGGVAGGPEGGWRPNLSGIPGSEGYIPSAPEGVRPPAGRVTDPDARLPYVASSAPRPAESPTTAESVTTSPGMPGSDTATRPVAESTPTRPVGNAEQAATHPVDVSSGGTSDQRPPVRPAASVPSRSPGEPTGNTPSTGESDANSPRPPRTSGGEAQHSQSQNEVPHAVHDTTAAPSAEGEPRPRMVPPTFRSRVDSLTSWQFRTHQTLDGRLTDEDPDRQVATATAAVVDEYYARATEGDSHRNRKLRTPSTADFNEHVAARGRSYAEAMIHGIRGTGNAASHFIRAVEIAGRAMGTTDDPRGAVQMAVAAMEALDETLHGPAARGRSWGRQPDDVMGALRTYTELRDTGASPLAMARVIETFAARRAEAAAKAAAARKQDEAARAAAKMAEAHRPLDEERATVQYGSTLMRPTQEIAQEAADMTHTINATSVRHGLALQNGDAVAASDALRDRREQTAILFRNVSALLDHGLADDLPTRQAAAHYLGELWPAVGHTLQPYLLERAEQIANGVRVLPEEARVIVALSDIQARLEPQHRDPQVSVLVDALTDAAFTSIGLSRYVDKPKKTNQDDEVQRVRRATTYNVPNRAGLAGIPGFIRAVYVASLSSFDVRSGNPSPRQQAIIAGVQESCEAAMIAAAQEVSPAERRSIPEQLRGAYDRARKLGDRQAAQQRREPNPTRWPYTQTPVEWQLSGVLSDLSAQAAETLPDDAPAFARLARMALRLVFGGSGRQFN